MTISLLHSKLFTNRLYLQTVWPNISDEESKSTRNTRNY